MNSNKNSNQCIKCNNIKYFNLMFPKIKPLCNFCKKEYQKEQLSKLTQKEKKCSSDEH